MYSSSSSPSSTSTSSSSAVPISRPSRPSVMLPRLTSSSHFGCGVLKSTPCALAGLSLSPARTLWLPESAFPGPGVKLCLDLRRGLVADGKGVGSGAAFSREGAGVRRVFAVREGAGVRSELCTLLGAGVLEAKALRVDAGMVGNEPIDLEGGSDFALVGLDVDANRRLGSTSRGQLVMI